MARPSPAVSAADVRSVFATTAAGAWVVTAAGPDGPVGFTLITVLSVSNDPPLVSFHIGKASSSLDTIRQSGLVAAHLLAHDQTDVAKRFAGDRSLRFRDDDSWTYDDDGLPCLHGAAARLVLGIEEYVDAGDSYIALASVAATAERTDDDPLLFHRGHFVAASESLSRNETSK